MERSEPSLVPEWLRSTAAGNHVSSSKSDGPLVALPKRNRNLINPTHSDTANSSLLERSSSTNSRRSSSTNGSTKHDNNPYSRSYSGSARNQRPKDRDKLAFSDSWDSDFSDPLSTIIGGRSDKDSLRRSQSMIARKPDEFPHRRTFTNFRNRGANGTAAVSVATASTGTQKVSFERDFPLLGSDDRPTTPDITRVPSPGLTRGVQSLSIGTSPLISCEGWTSALAEVPVVGTNTTTSSPSLQPASCAVGAPPSSASTSTEPAAPNGLNMAEALVQGSVRTQNVPQQSAMTPRFDELPSVGVKKLIPMTSSMSKTSMLNPSDKLKPKTAARSNDSVTGPKNGLQQLPSLQVGNQVVRGSARADALNASSTGKLQLLKPGREKVVSPVLKDAPAQTTKVTSGIANGQSPGSPSAASLPFKNHNNKHSHSERKASAYSLNGVQVVDKRQSHAQLQSRNDFFNLVRKRSKSSTSSDADSDAVVSSTVQNTGEQKEITSVPVSPTDNGSEMNCNGDACSLAEGCADQRAGDFNQNELIHPEEELDFLRALGWEDDGGDDEGLTEEEINAFVEKYLKWRPKSKLLQGLQLKLLADLNPPESCSAGDSSSELRAADSSL